MDDFSKSQDYEEAASIRDMIKAVRLVTSQQVILSKVYRECDAIGIGVKGDLAAIVVIHADDGEIKGQESWPLIHRGDEGDSISRFIVEHYTNRRPPKILLCPIPISSTIQEWLNDRRGSSVDVRVPKRGDFVTLTKLAKQNAILKLFGAIHGNYIINLRFYYNPITSLLEPIAFDGDSGEKLTKYTHFMFLDKKKDSVYLKELAYALHEVSQPEYLNDLMAKHKPEMDELLKPLKNEIKNSRGFLLANLQYNQEILKGELERIKGIYEIEDIKTEANTIERLEPPDIKRWQNNNTILVKTKIKKKNKDVYNLSRDNTSASAYTVITNNKVSFGQEYSSSVLVKKSSSWTQVRRFC